MSYQYSQTNRLEEPHNYMYTPFQGAVLLQSYQSSRMSVMLRQDAGEPGGGAEPERMFAACALTQLERLHAATSSTAGRRFRALLESGGATTRQGKPESVALTCLARGLGVLTTVEHVTTLDLLSALIAVQLTDARGVPIKVWLDRLVQRFEVTKRLYEFYPPGFRKGEGASTSIGLYWLFSLTLCLYYAGTAEIKYLSTLLKVNDLLCSLPENMLKRHIPDRGLATVLASEVISVELLAEKKGVTFAPK